MISFFNLSSDLGEKETFWMLFRLISSLIVTRFWFSFDGRVTSISPKRKRCTLQQKRVKDSVFYLQDQKKVKSIKSGIWWTQEHDVKQGRPSILDHQQTWMASLWLAVISSSLWFPVCAGGTGSARGALLQKISVEMKHSKVMRRRTGWRRVTGSLCVYGVGADIKFSNGWKNGDSQQSLFLCDLRMNEQSNTCLQEGISHNVFCSPCCQINWGSEVLEVANRVQKVSGPPPGDTSRVTRYTFTEDELRELQKETNQSFNLWESLHTFIGVSLHEHWMEEMKKNEYFWLAMN